MRGEEDERREEEERREGRREEEDVGAMLTVLLQLHSSSIAQSRIDMRRMYSLKNFCPANTPAAQQLALKVGKAQ